MTFSSIFIDSAGLLYGCGHFGMWVPFMDRLFGGNSQWHDIHSYTQQISYNFCDMDGIFGEFLKIDVGGCGSRNILQKIHAVKDLSRWHEQLDRILEEDLARSRDEVNNSILF